MRMVSETRRILQNTPISFGSPFSLHLLPPGVSSLLRHSSSPYGTEVEPKETPTGREAGDEGGAEGRPARVFHPLTVLLPLRDLRSSAFSLVTPLRGVCE